MFSFTKPRPPLSTAQRVDLEILIRRTLEVFGASVSGASVSGASVSGSSISETMLDLTGIPFDRVTLSSNLESVARSLSPRFAIDPQTLHWEIETDETSETPFTYEEVDDTPGTDIFAAVITVNPVAIEDDLRIVMLVASALARHAWQRRATRPLDLDVRTTSLLPIVLGMGVIASEASLYDSQWSTVGWSGWSLSRSGYYNSMEIGYAMALVDRARRHGIAGDLPSSRPAWLKHLRLDSRSVAKQALRYFQDQDQQHRPLLLDTPRIPISDRDTEMLVTWLRSEDLSFALYAARVLSQQGFISDRIIDAAINATTRDDVDLVAQATRLLGKAGSQHLESQHSEIQHRLVQLSNHRSPAIQLAAIDSATQVGMPHAAFTQSAEQLLHCESFDLTPVLDWIAAGGEDCAPLAPILTQHLEDALAGEHQPAAQQLTSCLESITPQQHD